MYIVLKKIYSLLTRKERWQLAWLSLAIVMMALIEAAGVASIMPFMAVVGNPEAIESIKWINWIYRTSGFESTDRFLVFLGFVALGVIVTSNIVKAATTWMEMRFTNYLGANLSKRILFKYLSQPYEYFIKNNTSTMEMILLQEIKIFTHLLLQPLTHVFASVVVIVFLFALLIIINPLLSFLIFGTFGSAYLILFFLVKKATKKFGDIRFEANIKRSKSAREALCGIKELRVLGRGQFFYNLFSLHANEMARGSVFHQTVSHLPRYFMEVLAFGGILSILIYFLLMEKYLGDVLPFMALYAFAGYRLMPQMQGIFSSLNDVRFNLSVLESLYAVQKENENFAGQSLSTCPVGGNVLRFFESIEMREISFSYPETNEQILSNFNINIKKNARVGFVGPSGSGKTTTVDILLGLLTPQNGQILVDGVPVTAKNISRWQCNLGYVPQSIFLCDDTLANNIAFGVPPETLDMGAVERAARLANLHDFVVNELPHGYSAVIGESGVRLSGGQRQRIGIARALYHDPEVLVMDEATSALDGISESAVMQAINSLAGEKTIITIAHRLTTLRDCDVIYVMERGRVVEEGTYDQLSRDSARFQAMGNSALSTLN